MGTHSLSCNGGAHLGRTQNPDTPFSFFLSFPSCKCNHLYLIKWKGKGEKIVYRMVEETKFYLQLACAIYLLPLMILWLLFTLPASIFLIVLTFPSPPLLLFLFKMAILSNVTADTFQVSILYCPFHNFTMIIKF